MAIIAFPKHGFFRVALSYDEWLDKGKEFIEDVKATIKCEDRDYDPADYEWVFGEEHHSVLKTLLRIHFPGKVDEL